jgi:hypothetical protein
MIFSPGKNKGHHKDLSWTAHISFEESILMNTLETYIQGSNYIATPKIHLNKVGIWKWWQKYNLYMSYTSYTPIKQLFVARSPSSDDITKSVCFAEISHLNWIHGLLKKHIFWVGARKETKKCVQDIGKLELVGGW